MKKKFILTLCAYLTAACALHADVNTDRAMSKISRDSRTYISADCRAATEQEAYDNAFADLTRQITSYMNETHGGSNDAVYLPEVSSIYQRLDSRISENRYRVFLYVKKADLKPLGGNVNAMVLSRKGDDDYKVVPTSKSEPVIVRDTVTVVEVVEKPMHPVISALSGQTDKNTFLSSLTQLRKDNKISAAAAFPMASLDDFYIGIIKDNSVTNIIHIVDGHWIDAMSGTEVNPTDFTSSSAYWFTLTK